MILNQGAPPGRAVSAGDRQRRSAAEPLGGRGSSPGVFAEGQTAMDYKTILTHVRADAASGPRTELAMTVAGMFDATLYGVAAETWEPAIARPEYGLLRPAASRT